MPKIFAVETGRAGPDWLAPVIVNGAAVDRELGAILALDLGVAPVSPASRVSTSGMSIANWNSYHRRLLVF